METDTGAQGRKRGIKNLMDAIKYSENDISILKRGIIEEAKGLQGVIDMMNGDMKSYKNNLTKENAKCYISDTQWGLKRIGDYLDSIERKCEDINMCLNAIHGNLLIIGEVTE